MSRADELVERLFVAKERNLDPLLPEGVEVIGLDEEEAEILSELLTDAWLRGVNSGMWSIRNESEDDPFSGIPDPADLERQILEFLESSTETLDLDFVQTIRMWEFLNRAWVAGISSSRAQLIAVFGTPQGDVGEEAFDFLRELEDESDEDDVPAP